MTAEALRKFSNDENEFNLFDLIKLLWAKRRTLFKYAISFFTIGVIFIIFTPNTYKVKTLVIPQSEKINPLAQMSSIASIAGIDLGISSASNSNVLSPDLYNDILRSLPFELELLNSTFYVKRINKKVPLWQYYNEYQKNTLIDLIIKYTLGLPSLIKESSQNEVNFVMTDSLFFLSKKHEKLIKKLTNNIFLDIDEKEKTISIIVSYDDPYLAAQVSQKTLQLLEQYIIRYKLEKTQNKYKFVQERYAETKLDFERSQYKLASFRDRNRNISTSLIKAEEERLQSEYNLAFNVFLEIAKQLELIRIQLKEDMPILTVINPPVIPEKASSPNKPLMLFSFSFFGLLIGTAIIVIKSLFDKRETN